ncbi:MAG: carbohydrate ABC transporter permease [Anaerolineae bacterium]|jgi:ABC-type glycerol-3-phosphate transport system permease component|nr:carbohydrate ABC transporter permease [Anaerolineae bacterium]
MKRPKFLRPSNIRGTIFLVIALVIGIIFALPFIYMISTSLKGQSELFTRPATFFPTKGYYFQAYLDVWSKGKFDQYFMNSVVVSSASTLVSVVIAILAGLGFARYKLPNKLLLSILVSQLFPLVLLVPPFFVVFRQMGLYDTHAALIISYVSFALPYSVWMLTGYFRSIPIDLEEAAQVDGATRLGAYLRITLPLATPGIAATIVYCFILAWNEFLFAFTFISNPSLRTLPVGLQMFIGQYGVEWNLLMAGAVVTTIPVVVLFVILQRYLVAGLTAGAVKG